MMTEEYKFIKQLSFQSSSASLDTKRTQRLTTDKFLTDCRRRVSQNVVNFLKNYKPHVERQFIFLDTTHRLLFGNFEQRSFLDGNGPADADHHIYVFAQLDHRPVGPCLSIRVCLHVSFLFPIPGS